MRLAEEGTDEVRPDYQSQHAFPECQVQEADGEEPAGEPKAAHAAAAAAVALVLPFAMPTAAVLSVMPALVTLHRCLFAVHRSDVIYGYIILPFTGNKTRRRGAPCFVDAGDVGIEPTLAVLETAVLPLNESPESTAF